MKENYSPELWIAEGTTSYYENIILARAGLIKPEQVLDLLSGAIQGDHSRPGNSIQSVADASFDAWVKFWHNDEQAYNSESDYYGKGATISLLLDFEIRHRSQNAHSLDDVMRALYHRFPLGGPGYTLADVQQSAEELAGSSLNDFFKRYVYGVEPLPWDSVLQYAGLEIKLKDSIPKPWLGVATYDAGGRTKITRVVAGSPAYSAGLDVNDELLALNGMRVNSSDLGQRISEMKAGTKIELTVFRDDRLRQFTATLENNPWPEVTVTKSANPTELQKSIYTSWLGQPWDTPRGSPSPAH